MVRRGTKVFRQRHAGLRSESVGTYPAGFTLVELLVVLAIISLLLAVLLPSLQGARRRAKATVCLSHLKQWGTAFTLYVQDSEGRLPAETPKGIWLLGGISAGQSGPNEFQVGATIYTEGIACCPMATRLAHRSGTFTMGVDANSVPVLGTMGRAFSAWEVTSPGVPFCGSYGLNQSLFEPQVSANVEPKEPPPDPPSRARHARGLPVFRRRPHPEVEPAKKQPIREMNVFTVKGTAHIPILLDSIVPIHTPGGEGAPPRDDSGTDPVGMGPFCMDRHDGYVNGLFVDWSVRKLGLKELWTLKWNGQWNPAGRWTKAGGVKPEDWPKWMRKCKDY
jgi:prepilin-type N-terminal cleavage/methylation domain-containing protein/prepilin-type processing-associated H-X9-DG protein